MNTKSKILYHGSGIEITDGFIRIKPAYLTKTNEPITAVFALSDFVHAKLYAIMRLVAGKGKMSPCERNSVYIQRINQEIPKKAYVYELDSDGFQQDVGGSYYCLTDKKIKSVIEIDVRQEIKDGNLKIYVLKDEFNKPEFSRAEWVELVKDKNKFELYKPDSKKLEMQILAKTLENSSKAL
jgi:hypothetical protein